MKLEVMEKKDNPLYERREVVARVLETEATPSRKEILGELCKALGCAPETVVIDRVSQKFGRNACTVTAKVYSKPELIAKYDRAWKAARTAGKKVEKKEEAAAPAKAPEKKAEAPAPAPAAEKKEAAEPAPAPAAEKK